jgi:hypothetical protein
LRPRLTTGSPLSQRTRMCPQEPIITRADEFPMNFEGLGVSFRHFFYFPQHFASGGANFGELRQREVLRNAPKRNSSCHTAVP